MTSQISLHCRNALASGAASLLTLFGMALWIGGGQEFPGIVSSGIGLFLLISLGGLVLGSILSSRRIQWSLLVGVLSGLAGGTAIVLHGMSQI
jgi:hypothetical protein